MEEMEEEKSLVETPTWAVASVVTVMVLIGFSINGVLRHIEKWLYRTKRKALSAALDKIKEELMLFAVLSLLMGHWIVYAAKICVRSSAISSRFYPCSVEKKFVNDQISFGNYSNYSVSRQLLSHKHSEICPEGSSSFASKESLEQLHRFLFVLGVTHVSYSFFAVALAMIKIYSWRIWENQAKSMPEPHPQGMTRLSTFIYRNTAHPWSQHNILVWLLCFSRQMWSSISRADYRALRLGFLTTHNLPLNYDFHNYIIRSMEEEFRDIVGISIPLWIFAILCIFLGFHGTYIYFWLSFLPAILIVLVGTKLQRIVIKLAVETKKTSQHESQRTDHRINLSDELFWFRRPWLLLRLIQFISFQNAFEMATCLWSLWEVNGTSCFTKSQSFLVIRLTFGVVSQFWCSFNTFPLYVIVTQMGSRFKKTIVSKNVRESLHTWRRRVKAKHRHNHTSSLLPSTASTMSLESMVDDDHDEIVPISSPDAFIKEAESRVLEDSTHDEEICSVPVTPPDDDDNCDEQDFSFASAKN